jgi:hypothetical protein
MSVPVAGQLRPGEARAGSCSHRRQARTVRSALLDTLHWLRALVRLPDDGLATGRTGR